jgi:tetraacyldisaccharide 4'-kinase
VPSPRRAPSPPQSRRRKKSSFSSVGALLLAPLSLLYGAVAALRDRSWRERRRSLSRPVVSVGNLTFGGTGKTPTVIFVCSWFLARGHRPAILSRGYRSEGADGNDEAQVIHRHLPDVEHFQDPDRYRAGSSVQERFDLFVLDDGFQHHPLQRDLDLVLVDATDPFGGGWCPPGGRLREPLSALGRADAVILTRADQVDREDLGETMRRVREKTHAPVATARFAPACAEDISGREVFVACGIGNPGAFVRTVETLGAVVAGERFFRDHHAYSAADARELAGQSLPVVVTEKDAVKLERLWPAGATPLVVVTIGFEFLEGGDAVLALLEQVCR